MYCELREGDRLMGYFKKRKERKLEEQRQRELKIHQMKVQKMKSIIQNIMNWMRNGIGLLLCIVAIVGMMSGDLLPSILCLLLGVSITKVFSNILIKIGLNLSKGLKLAIIVVLFFSFAISVSSDNTKESKDNSDTIASLSDNTDEEQKVEESKQDDQTKEETIETSKEETSKTETTNSTSDKSNENDNLFKGYKKIEVNSCNLSGHREPNVVVDIGYGDREYWAFTNQYGQLVKVTAKKIELQHDGEEITSNGRYCRDEAKVSGVESKDLDEGHIIADSLGGVSNAYNITPQNSTLNRHGDQAYMEKVIRDAGGCTDFTAIITYPNTTTQIPSHYSYTYKINGRVVKDEFDNKNPEGNKKPSNSNNTNKKPSNSTNSSNKGNSSTNSNQVVDKEPQTGKVWISATGTKYHNKPDCGRMNPNTASQLTVSEAKRRGFDACKKCF